MNNSFSSESVLSKELYRQYERTYQKRSEQDESHKFDVKYQALTSKPNIVQELYYLPSFTSSEDNYLKDEWDSDNSQILTAILRDESCFEKPNIIKKRLADKAKLGSKYAPYYWGMHRKGLDDLGYLEKYLKENILATLPPSSEINVTLHEKWWSRISTLEKLRNHPREFLSYGTFGLFVLTASLLVGGLILNRMILMPDFGVSILIISMIFWLMTQVAK
jgi:hypothetical protein